MTTAAPHRTRYAHGRLGVALAVLVTILAGAIFPLGGLLVGLAFAYIVWGDSPQMKYRFAMLAGVSTIFWALCTLSMTGLFDTVTSHVDQQQVVHAPAGWVAPH